MLKKVFYAAARLTTNLLDNREVFKNFAGKQKMRIMVMLLEEKKKKHSEVNLL